MSSTIPKADPKVIVEPIRERDIDGAVSCIQRAFSDDPYKNWVFDASTFSATRNHASLRVRCLWGMRHALFYVARDASTALKPGDETGKVLGVSMWLPPTLARPTKTLAWSAYLRSFADWKSWQEWTTAQLTSWSLWLAQVHTNLRHGRGGLIVRRYYIWKAAQAEAQKELWDDEAGYYFCNIVTVVPEAQGRGIGRLLMSAVLQKADKNRAKCYLESSREEPNVPIYEQMSFSVVRKMECKDGKGDQGVVLYCMI